MLFTLHYLVANDNYFFNSFFVYVIFICILHFPLGCIGEVIVKSKGYKHKENYGFLWGFFLGIIGIIICCAKPSVLTEQQKERLNGQSSSYRQNNYPLYPTQNDYSLKPISEQIQEIKQLKEEGLITEEEYNAKKKQILGL